jgi:peptidoglycan/LPS O-acetylase OafA/YrhL
MAKVDARAAAGGGGRVRALDGLRGVAALVVLVHHSLLASAPSLAAVYTVGVSEPWWVADLRTPARGSFEWLLAYSPLHLFWAGPEFVVVFFVLSGFVLALPVANGLRLAVGTYYPTRMLRLYLPVWGALVLAAVMHRAVGHTPIPGASWWLDLHSAPLTYEALTRDALLGAHAGDWAYTDVLWSLHWEVLFSLLLPVLLLAPFASSPVRAAIVALCFVFLLRGSNAYMLELPPFVLGMVLAFERERIGRLALRLKGRSALRVLVKLALAATCVCALTADWMIPYAQAALIALGACLAVICAMALGSLRTLLESAPLQWVGRRAFSLYLVHQPLVVALAFALGARLAPVPFVVLAGAAALALCALFFRFIEAPFHVLAREWGARCGQRLASIGLALSVRGAAHRSM